LTGLIDNPKKIVTKPIKITEMEEPEVHIPIIEKIEPEVEPDASQMAGKKRKKEKKGGKKKKKRKKDDLSIKNELD